VNITVSGGSGITIGDFQDAKWVVCGGTCGDGGGDNGTDTYTITKVTVPPGSEGGSTTGLEFNISNAKGTWPSGYANVYDTPLTNTISSLTYSFDLYVPQQYVNTPQGIEFECQQIFGGNLYNFAWIADYGNKDWGTFDYPTKKWVSSGIPFTPFTGNTWHHIEVTFHTVGTTIYFDTLQVDGTTHSNLGITHKTVSNSADQFTNAVQLDVNENTEAGYYVYIDNMAITVQPY
jgi:hypothetical protein